MQEIKVNYTIIIITIGNLNKYLLIECNTLPTIKRTCIKIDF